MLLTILAQNVMIGSVSPPIPSDPFIQIGDDDGGGYTERHYDKEKKVDCDCEVQNTQNNTKPKTKKAEQKVEEKAETKTDKTEVKN